MPVDDHVYFEQRYDEMQAQVDRRFDEMLRSRELLAKELSARIDSSHQQLSLHIGTQKESVELALKSLNQLLAERDKAAGLVEDRQREAIGKAEAALNARLENMNEFRAQILSERGNFITREVVGQMAESRDNRIAALEKWQAKMLGAFALAIVGMPMVVAVITYVLTRHAVPVGK